MGILGITGRVPIILVLSPVEVLEFWMFYNSLFDIGLTRGSFLVVVVLNDSFLENYTLLFEKVYVRD